ncbi:hypothetical protein [Microbacterium sp. 2FI]|uniref:hypothetical protein n=1 Tax=Microbacterium sp. 2FI TaxID=2502193 RepID=UPI0010F4BED6|nr:hypothetical protein [Microbacterium sp. 2FI]
MGTSGGTLPQLRELHTTAEAARAVTSFAVVIGVLTVLSAFFLDDLPRLALNVAAQAAPIVLPMYLSALVAALVFLVVPGFRREPGVRESDQIAETRQLVGVFGGMLTGIFIVWVGWSMYSAFEPAIATGANGAVLLCAPLLVPLGVLVTRVSRGTLEQQRRDLVRDLETGRAWRAKVEQRVIRREHGQPARWPILVVSSGSVASLGLNCALWVTTGQVATAWIVFVGQLSLVVFAVTAYLIAYRTINQADRLNKFILFGLITAAYVLLLDVVALVPALIGGAPGWLVASLIATSVLGLLLPLMPWGSKRPLAALSLRKLVDDLAKLEERANRIEDALRVEPARRHPWWKTSLSSRSAR